MALAGVAPDVMRPTALVLNLVVAVIGTIRFARAGLTSWKALLPLVVTSVTPSQGQETLPDLSDPGVNTRIRVKFSAYPARRG